MLQFGADQPATVLRDSCAPKLTIAWRPGVRTKRQFSEGSPFPKGRDCLHHGIGFGGF